MGLTQQKQEAKMAHKVRTSIGECFGTLTDPRVPYLIEHKLLDMLTIAICAIISGANTWVEVEAYGHSKKEWLSTFLELPNDIPSHDTFNRLFARLNGEEFQECFVAWARAAAKVTRGQVVAIDGKCLRRSHDRALGKEAIYMVSAWATQDHLVLGQTKVAEKSNEITAIPVLLRLLDLQGCIVTIDAMGCQKKIAKAILDQGADYILAVKDNQPTLHQKMVSLFDQIDRANRHTRRDYDSEVSKDHGRIETRRCWTITDESYLLYTRDVDNKPWPGLGCLVKIEAQRTIAGVTSTETRYFISSLKCSAAKMLKHIRSHWGIENSLHWVLDVAFGEDQSRLRKGNGPENIAVLRHMALSLLQRETSSKGGIHARRLRAAWDTNYLLKVLGC